MTTSFMARLTMRIALPLALASCLLPLLPSPGHAAEVCTPSESTVAETRCVMAALEAKDQALQKALALVASEARQVPSDTFPTLWRDNLTGFYKTSADPREQASAFRAERRKVCAFAKSMSFQGTGYGIFTTRCELALTQTLLEQLQP